LAFIIRKDSLLQNPSVLQVIKEHVQLLHHILDIFYNNVDEITLGQLMYGTAWFGTKLRTINLKKSKTRQMLEVIKIKHSCVIPGDKYVPIHSAN
jgi:hypothetical protein